MHGLRGLGLQTSHKLERLGDELIAVVLVRHY